MEAAGAGRARLLTKFRAATIAASFNPQRPDPVPEEPEPILLRAATKVARFATALTPKPPMAARIALNPREELRRMRSARKYLLDPRTSRLANA